MAKLKSTAKGPRAFCDLLNYAVLLKSGLVLCKDGSLLAGVEFFGRDTGSMDVEELNVVSSMMNERFKQLGQGWSLQLEAIRRSITGYPDVENMHFPDDISRLIDEERRAQYEQEGYHYATSYYFLLSYLPPSLMKGKLEQKVYASSGEERNSMQIASDVFADVFFGFITDMGEYSRVVQLRGYEIQLEPGEIAKYDGLIDLLHELITGNCQRVRLADSLIFLDSILGKVDVVAGLEPIVDDKHLRVVAVDGFPGSTYPDMLRVLNTLPFPYRWSGRFIYLDNDRAKSAIHKFYLKWAQKRTSIVDQLLSTPNPKVDSDAANMSHDAEQAETEVSSDLYAFGYFNGAVILMGKEVAWVEDVVKNVLAVLRNAGFSGRDEKLNCMDAWIGSLAGHNYANIRRPLINTRNLVDILPLSGPWNGHKYNPCDKYPLNSPPLMLTSSFGGNVFQFNLHVKDLGHTLILGPTGAGKSTLLGILAAQFLRYPSAQVFSFDKGYSLHCLTHGVGGSHYDIGGGDEDSSGLMLAPLQELDTVKDRAWASNWIELCCRLQLDRKLTPDERNLIHSMITALSHEKKEARSMSVAVAQIQNKDLRDSLHRYTLSGSMGRLLDGESDPLKLSRFVCFELESLMRLGESDLLPVLMYLFRRIERSLDGTPTLILLDEAWTMMQHPIFREQLIVWLRTMRKNNAAVVLATQSASDADKSGMLDTLMEATATCIYLPNPAAQSEVSGAPYRKMGLNSMQIAMIAGAKQKLHYYICSGDGKIMVDLKLGKLALAFVGQSGIVAMHKVNKCIAEHKSKWVGVWLKQLGLSSEAVKCGFKEINDE